MTPPSRIGALDIAQAIHERLGSGRARVADLLNHLFVLIPVLDNSKHYFIGEDEVAKLLRKGEGWLDQHPERELIVSRYLKGFKSLVRAAHRRLTPASITVEC